MFRACGIMWAKCMSFLTCSSFSLACLWLRCASPAFEFPAPFNLSACCLLVSHLDVLHSLWDLHILSHHLFLTVSLDQERTLVYHFPYVQGNGRVHLRKATTKVTAGFNLYSLILCHWERMKESVHLTFWASKTVYKAVPRKEWGLHSRVGHFNHDAFFFFIQGWKIEFHHKK